MGQAGIEGVSQYYRDVKWMGAESYVARRDKRLTHDEQIKKAGQMEAEIRSIISGIDDKGRWINNDMITCRDFVLNVNMLFEYLELSKN